MKTLATAVAASLLVMTGPALAAETTIAQLQIIPVRVSISAIPNGAKHGVLTFTGVPGVKSVKVVHGPPGTTAKPLNTPSGKGFTLDFKPGVNGSGSALVCFMPTARTPGHAAFSRGSWSFAPAKVVVPINPKNVKVDDCLE